MIIKAVPAWVEDRNLSRRGQELRSYQDGVIWSYVLGEGHMSLSGGVTAQQLRDLADMIDANQPFSLAGWASWSGMVFECRSNGGIGLRHPRQHGAAVEGRWTGRRLSPESIVRDTGFTLVGWARWADMDFWAACPRSPVYIRGPKSHWTSGGYWGPVL